MTIKTPGIYMIPESEYFADPCEMPSLSHSIAKMLLDRSPAHAWSAHPRLGNQREDGATKASDTGTILHKLLLGRGADIAEIDAKDWRTNAAKEARDEARAAGKTPVLASDMTDIYACAKAARRQIESHPDLGAFFEAGKSEAVIAWQDGGIWCRGMVDRLPDAPRVPVFDIKTTALSGAPESWERRVVHEYATQAAFYRRGLKAIRRVEPGPFLFVVIEVNAPYAVSVLTPAPSLLAYAEAEIERAIELWRDCIAADKWPGYAPFTAHVELPGYLAMRSEERAIRREIMAERYDPTNAFAEEFQE